MVMIQSIDNKKKKTTMVKSIEFVLIKGKLTNWAGHKDTQIKQESNSNIHA